MTNDCKTCPVSTGTHKPAEAVHQIDEPQTDALDLADKLEKDVWQATPLRLSKVVELAAEALRAQSARIAELEKENSYLNNACTELESQLEAIGAGGVEPLRKPAAAPQAVQAAVPDGWVPCVITYEGQHPEEIAYGPQVMMNRLKKWLDRYFEMRAAPAHPAEGVPAQAAQPSDALIEAVDAWFAENTGLGGCSDKDVAELAAIFATQPAAQGLDALDAARYRWLRERDLETVHKGGVFAGMTPENYVINGVDLDAGIDAALAAQAKQGGADHG
ncbi:hypothetical protein KXJ72_11500 [Comamonas aquatica]|nr:hypothetical protein KXJ72_11500 [Comamonas aquatica]